MSDLFGGNFGWAAEPASQSVAAVSPNLATFRATEKIAENCAFEPHAVGDVANVASVAPWKAGIERLSLGRRPDLIDVRAWNLLVSDARMLLQNWGAEFAEYGWSTLDVFGVPVRPRGRRLGISGLISLLQGRPVDAVDVDTATIRNVRGEPNRFYRRLRADGAVPVWEWVR